MRICMVSYHVHVSLTIHNKRPFSFTAPTVPAKLRKPTSATQPSKPSLAQECEEVWLQILKIKHRRLLAEEKVSISVSTQTDLVYPDHSTYHCIANL